MAMARETDSIKRFYGYWSLRPGFWRQSPSRCCALVSSHFSTVCEDYHEIYCSEFMMIQGDSMVVSWEDILWRYEIEWRYNGISNHIDMILGYFGCIWNWGILSIKKHFNENNDDKPWDLGCPVFRQTHVELIQRTWGFWNFGRWCYQSESMQTCRNRGFEHVIFWLNIEHIGGRMFD